MGSVRQRRARKTSVRKATRRNKDKQRKINVASNPIIAANWDYSQTLTQNYKRLGLTARLGLPSGGKEKNLDAPVLKKSLGVKEDIANGDDVDESELKPEHIPKGEARIIRDEDGNVVKVIYGTKTALDEDLKLVQEPEVEPKTKVVEQLEHYAKCGVTKVERIQSDRESAWIQALYEKHGDDYEKMKWDKKLNIYQQSAGDLKRRITKWKKKNNIVAH